MLQEHGNETVTEESIAALEGFVQVRQWLNAQKTPYLITVFKFQTYSEIGNEPLPHYAMGLDLYATWTSYS